ncbi:hypothetical protein ACQPZQ_29745 [Pseudonocardia sp. CA-142604]|uniref:hypothetical protein n=1 Tax=Pseudonocardia sp. CA-142604 TaxID=3240024 RepID=UPI003D8D5C2C
MDSTASIVSSSVVVGVDVSVDSSTENGAGSLVNVDVDAEEDGAGDGDRDERRLNPVKLSIPTSTPIMPPTMLMKAANFLLSDSLPELPESSATKFSLLDALYAPDHYPWPAELMDAALDRTQGVPPVG